MEDVTRLGRGDDVAVMIFTEFRSGSKRTGASARPRHGDADVRVWEGSQRGPVRTSPEPPDLDDGNMKMTTDFRRVYATMIDEWLGLQDTPPS